jgi:hypothetical protein
LLVEDITKDQNVILSMNYMPQKTTITEEAHATVLRNLREDIKKADERR